MLLNPFTKQIRMQIVRPSHSRYGNTTLLATGDHLGLELNAELTPMAPTFLRGKLVRMHYSTYWDELLHQENSGAAILYDLPLELKMVLPDAYETQHLCRFAELVHNEQKIANYSFLPKK